MAKPAEKVLLYRIANEERLAELKGLFRKLNIPTVKLPDDAYKEKIGYLVGQKGFKPNKSETEPFNFDHEVMVMHNIKNKRLDQVLEAFRDGGVKTVTYKAIVTPYNILWTLGRLCQTMEKEHGAMIAAKNKEGNQ